MGTCCIDLRARARLLAAAGDNTTKIARACRSTRCEALMGAMQGTRQLGRSEVLALVGALQASSSATFRVTDRRLAEEFL